MFDGLTFNDYSDAIKLVIKTIKASENIDELWRKLRNYEHKFLEMAETEYKIAWNNNSHAVFQLYLKADNLAWIMDNFASELEYYKGLDGYVTFPYTLDFAKQLVSTNGSSK